MTSLNPLESGQSFESTLAMRLTAQTKLSQSPRIGAVIRIQIDGSAQHDEVVTSQSPRIGAVIRMNEIPF